MKQVMDKYPNDVRWVFRHFPLDSIHPNARPAAIASECVNDLKGNDGFWTFVDAMYANQDGLSNDFYEKTAQGIGVDMTKFKDCVSKKTTASKVEDQYQGGIAIGVQGTPGSYLNGNALGGAVPFAQLDSQIAAAIGQ
jgi:protein-disulfide isomerase